MKFAHRPGVRLAPLRNGDELPLPLVFLGNRLIGRLVALNESDHWRKWTFTIIVGELAVNQGQQRAWPFIYERYDLIFEETQ